MITHPVLDRSPKALIKRETFCLQTVISETRIQAEQCVPRRIALSHSPSRRKRVRSFNYRSVSIDPSALSDWWLFKVVLVRVCGTAPPDMEQCE